MSNAAESEQVAFVVTARPVPGRVIRSLRGVCRIELDDPDSIAVGTLVAVHGEPRPGLRGSRDVAFGTVSERGIVTLAYGWGWPERKTWIRETSRTAQAVKP